MPIPDLTTLSIDELDGLRIEELSRMLLEPAATVGLFDLLGGGRRGIGAVGGPYRVEIAEGFCTGRMKGDLYSPGRSEGEVFNAGSVAGAVDG